MTTKLDGAERVALAGWFTAAGALMELGHKMTTLGERRLARHRRRTDPWGPVPFGMQADGTVVSVDFHRPDTLQFTTVLSLEG